ncbi:hypothetical protein GCM10009611_08100 [Arthrobacter roseus]
MPSPIPPASLLERCNTFVYAALLGNDLTQTPNRATVQDTRTSSSSLNWCPSSLRTNETTSHTLRQDSPETGNNAM